MIKSFIFNKLLPQIYRFYLSVNLKPSVLNIESDSKCLCLAPHADDESIGMGGVLFKYPSNFKVVCLTNGCKGIKDLPPNEAFETRKKEFAEAMNVASIKDFDVFDIDDKHVICEYDKFQKIDISGFDYIFIPNILDQHVDHKSVALNLNRLLKEQKYKKNLKILLYEVWSALPIPNTYLDISDVIDKKKEMINSHKSQVEAEAYTEKAVSLNSYRGLLNNKAYVEAFVSLEVKAFSKLCNVIF